MIHLEEWLSRFNPTIFPSVLQLTFIVAPFPSESNRLRTKIECILRYARTHIHKV